MIPIIRKYQYFPISQESFIGNWKMLVSSMRQKDLDDTTEPHTFGREVCSFWGRKIPQKESKYSKKFDPFMLHSCEISWHKTL